MKAPELSDIEGHPVFVYGTLKQSFGNNSLLSDCRLIGDAFTIDTFKMYDVGFPVIFEDPDGAYVRGELWMIPWKVMTPVVTRLDRLESEGVMYARQTRAVRLVSSPSEDIETWVYVGIPDNWGSIPGTRAVQPRDDVRHLIWRPSG